VALHEALHACLPDLAEDAIDTIAVDVARLLWRLMPIISEHE